MEDRVNVHGRTVEDLFEPDGKDKNSNSSK